MVHRLSYLAHGASSIRSLSILSNGSSALGEDSIARRETVPSQLAAEPRGKPREARLEERNTAEERWTDASSRQTASNRQTDSEPSEGAPSPKSTSPKSPSSTTLASKARGMSFSVRGLAGGIGPLRNLGDGGTPGGAAGSVEWGLLRTREVRRHRAVTAGELRRETSFMARTSNLSLSGNNLALLAMPFRSIALLVLALILPLRLGFSSQVGRHLAQASCRGPQSHPSTHPILTRHTTH